MSIISAIASIFKPASDLIDELHTSDEEKLKLKIEIESIENAVTAKLIDAQSQIITTEAQGSWLQRNWRPITMLVFLVLIVCNQFGLLLFPLSQEVWTLFKIGLGGYVVGRTAEKVFKKENNHTNTS